MADASEAECEAAGLDPEQVRRLAARIERAARDAARPFRDHAVYDLPSILSQIARSKNQGLLARQSSNPAGCGGCGAAQSTGQPQLGYSI
jgi:hypothetical protein